MTAAWACRRRPQGCCARCCSAPLTASITMSPDALLLAAAVGAPASCVHVFDLPSSSLLASPAVRGSVEQVQWSADGRALQDGHGDVFNAP